MPKVSKHDLQSQRIQKAMKSLSEIVWGQPHVSQVLFPDKTTLELLQEIPTGEDPWNEAELWSPLEYVQRSKLLDLPDAYRILFTS